MDRRPVEPGGPDRAGGPTDDPWVAFPTVRKRRGARKRRAGSDGDLTDADAGGGAAALPDEGAPPAGSGG